MREDRALPPEVRHRQEKLFGPDLPNPRYRSIPKVIAPSAHLEGIWQTGEREG